MPPQDRRPRRRRPAASRPLRIRFEDQDSLSDAFARAQQESWVESCTADSPKCTLELRLAPGLASDPGAQAALRGRVRRITGLR